MAYMTDRKRAEGLGAAKTGTTEHWRMIVSSVALLILIPLFVFTFGQALGMEYEQAVAYYTRPFPAVVGILTFLVGWMHFRQGVQVAVEDYLGGMTRKAVIVAMICISYASAAAAVFAIARLAL